MKKSIEQIIRELNKGEPLQRMGTITRQMEKAEGETPAKVSYALSFSSEEPYERWFGMEILGHKAEEVDMSFMASGRAPVLLQHDARQQIGVIDSAAISGGRGTASIRFGAGALAKEIQQDVDDGIRGNVSVGYEVLDMALVKSPKDGPDEYRVTKWRPRELSIVSIPADETVGVGRGKTEPKSFNNLENTPMNEEEKKAAAEKAQREADLAKFGKDEVAKERARIDGILALGRAHRLGDEAEKAIRDGQPLADFQARALELLAKGHKPLAEKFDRLSDSEKKQVQKYSFRNAILAATKGGNLTGFELEMHQEGEKEARECGIQTSGIAVPYVVMHRDFLGTQQRSVATGLAVANQGANIVTEQFDAGSFIDVLRNQMVLTPLGAVMLPGLQGILTIPRKTAGISGEWAEEDEALTDATITLGQLTMTPKRLGTTLPYTKQLLLQGSMGIEQLIRMDFATGLALKLEHGAVFGAGDDIEPTGIVTLGTAANPSDIGTHGGALTYAHAVGLETLVATANAAQGRLAYLTNSKVRGFAKVTEAFATTGRTIWERDNTINGYPAQVTNMVPSTLTKGTSGAVCSALIFGDWSNLLIGMWGGLDLVVDEFTGAKKGLVQVTASMFADVGVRHPKAFAFAQDLLT
jgi:HK97 family phage major capsid protein